MNQLPLKEGIAGIIWFASILFLAWIPGQKDFHLILPALFVCFVAYAFLAKYGQEKYLRWTLFLAILARILVIPSFPNLSDDIYRFIWDGRLWHLGIHPFSSVPSQIVGTNDLLSQNLYQHLNSKDYFSIYPPVAQFIFWIATFLPSDNLLHEAIIMKSVHCLFDLGSLYLIQQLLRHFKLHKKRILLYALNPLIIIELVSNIHHEGIVIFFLLLTIFSIVKKYHVYAGMAISGAIATKILPLLFCPLLFFYVKGKGRWLFAFSVFLCTTVLFAPLITSFDLLTNLGVSADLYIRKFEFNAGIYYVLREMGYLIKGYNTIHILGPVLMSISALLIGFLAYISNKRKFNRNILIVIMIWSYLSYALLSITLHPWYIAVLIPLCLFTPYRTPLIWSGLIMLTYINYSMVPYHEVMFIVILEYIVVFSLFLYEIKKYGWLPAESAEGTHPAR